MALRILPTNFFDEATISVSPAAVSTLPATNLQSNVRDRLWRSPNLDRQVITGHWSGNVRVIDAIGVWPSAGTSSLIGSKWRFEFFQDASLTTSLYDTGELDFFAFSGSAFGSAGYGVEPYGVETSDRLARLAPLTKFFTAVNAASFRITVTNGGAVDTPYFEARRIWMADSVLAPYTARFGAQPSWRSNSEHLRTLGGALRRLARAKWRELRIETFFTSEADRAAWFDIVGAASLDKEIVLSVFAGEATRRERDFTVMGSLDVLNPVVFDNANFHTLQLAIVES